MFSKTEGSLDLGKQVLERGSVEQGRSFRYVLGASSKLADAVSPYLRLALIGAMPVLEVKPRKCTQHNTNKCSCIKCNLALNLDHP